MTRLFIEKPLASPGSAKNIYRKMGKNVQWSLILISIIKEIGGRTHMGGFTEGGK